MLIKLHSIIPVTEVNGPGKRFGIWMQGCFHHCDDCYNQKLKPFDRGYEIEIDTLVNKIIEQKEIEGISISGGEPFLQRAALIDLMEKIKQKTNLSILVFSFYTLKDLMNDDKKRKLLKYIDILAAGPYKKDLSTNEPLLSSSNQKIHYLTNRYNENELTNGDSELIIDRKGTVVLTGNHNFRI